MNRSCTVDSQYFMGSALLPNLTYFTSKYHLKTQFQRPYSRTSSYSAALWAAPFLERPGGPLDVAVWPEAAQKEYVKIWLWQLWRCHCQRLPRRPE